MIEALVAILILAIGLLGLAFLQAQGLKFNTSAYARTQASILHYAVASNTPDFAPTLFVDISETYEQKKRALAEEG